VTQTQPVEGRMIGEPVAQFLVSGLKDTAEFEFNRPNERSKKSEVGAIFLKSATS
jgi:hypothetical protein